MTEQAEDFIPKKCSTAYAEAINICNAAIWHKRYCIHPDCHVALYTLKATAIRLVPLCWVRERDEVLRLINEVTWI